MVRLTTGSTERDRSPTDDGLDGGRGLRERGATGEPWPKALPGERGGVTSPVVGAAGAAPELPEPLRRLGRSGDDICEDGAPLAGGLRSTQLSGQEQVARGLTRSAGTLVSSLGLLLVVLERTARVAVTAVGHSAHTQLSRARHRQS